MAIKFDYHSVFDVTEWIVLYGNAMGYQDKFYEICQEQIIASEFPNIETQIEEFKSGGRIRHKEVTKMLGVSFKKSLFNNLALYFRAQQFGNLVFYTLLQTCDKGFWKKAKGKSRGEVLASIRSNCANWAQYEEFTALNEYGNIVFRNAVKSLDPNWEENRYLFELK
jgi:hypothetical protein